MGRPNSALAVALEPNVRVRVRLDTGSMVLYIDIKTISQQVTYFKV